MFPIPKESRVGVTVLYNGYGHKTFGSLVPDPKLTKILLHPSEYPKGYRAEHDADTVTLTYASHCIVPDPSGEHGWVATLPFSIDHFAGPSQKTD